MNIGNFKLDRSQMIPDTVRIQFIDKHTNIMMRINNDGLELLDNIGVLGVDFHDI